MTLWAVVYPYPRAAGGVEAMPSTLSYSRNVAIRKYLSVWDDEAGRIAKTMEGAACALTACERRAWSRRKRKDGLRCIQVHIRPNFMIRWSGQKCQ